MTCVLDASVALKAAVSEDREPLAGAARSIRPPLAERWGLAAPSLIAWEVANVVHHKAPEAFGEDLEARSRAAKLVLQGISLDTPGEEDRQRTAELAEAEPLTAYDAAYLELADRLDGLLITDDEALLEAGRSILSADRCLGTAGAFHRIQDGVL